jgi:argininosuccinate lyase
MQNFQGSGRLSRYWQNPRAEQALICHDIDSALAHATMLGKTNIISEAEATKLLDALHVVRQEAAQGTFCVSSSDIDVQTSVERRLTEQVGALASVLKIARSRSDQVATDIRLWLRSATWEIFLSLMAVRQALINLAERDLDVIMPGYGYMHTDSPVVLAQWWLATEERLTRDFERLCDFYKRLNVLPMSAGSVAYQGKFIDRRLVADYLGFDGLIENSFDAITDRDYLVEFAAFASLVGTHLSQMSSELLVWATHEFGFVHLLTPLKADSASFSAKRNQSLLEILRSRPSVIFGRLSEFLAELKAIPLGYCQDLQECMPGLIDIVDNLNDILEIARIIIPAVQVDAKRMRAAASQDSTNFDNAVDFLVNKGIPHENAKIIVESLTQYCLQRNKTLADLGLNEWRQFSAAFDDDVYKHVTIEDSRSSTASIDPVTNVQVAEALERADNLLKLDRSRLPAQAIQQLNALELESI